MPLLPFLAYSTLGTIIWVGGLTYLGYILGDNYTLVEEYLGRISGIIVVSVLLFIVVWIIRRRNLK